MEKWERNTLIYFYVLKWNKESQNCYNPDYLFDDFQSMLLQDFGIFNNLINFKKNYDAF